MFNHIDAINSVVGCLTPMNHDCENKFQKNKKNKKGYIRFDSKEWAWGDKSEFFIFFDICFGIVGIGIVDQHLTPNRIKRSDGKDIPINDRMGPTSA